MVSHTDMLPSNLTLPQISKEDSVVNQVTEEAKLKVGMVASLKAVTVASLKVAMVAKPKEVMEVSLRVATEVSLLKEVSVASLSEATEVSLREDLAAKPKEVSVDSHRDKDKDRVNGASLREVNLDIKEVLQLWADKNH